jgi:hypothetical protein
MPSAAFEVAEDATTPRNVATLLAGAQDPGVELFQPDVYGEVPCDHHPCENQGAERDISCHAASK